MGMPGRTARTASRSATQNSFIHRVRASWKDAQAGEDQSTTVGISSSPSSSFARRLQCSQMQTVGQNTMSTQNASKS